MIEISIENLEEKFNKEGIKEKILELDNGLIDTEAVKFNLYEEKNFENVIEKLAEIFRLEGKQQEFWQILDLDFKKGFIIRR